MSDIGPSWPSCLDNPYLLACLVNREKGLFFSNGENLSKYFCKKKSIKDTEIWSSLCKHSVSLGTLFHSQFCMNTTYVAQKYQSYTDTALSGLPDQTSEIHFLCQEKFMFGQCRIQTRNFSICIQHATNGPMCHTKLGILAYHDKVQLQDKWKNNWFLSHAPFCLAHGLDWFDIKPVVFVTVKLGGKILI